MSESVARIGAYHGTVRVPSASGVAAARAVPAAYTAGLSKFQFQAKPQLAIAGVLGFPDSE
jgi:hypothetical protein